MYDIMDVTLLHQGSVNVDEAGQDQQARLVDPTMVVKVPLDGNVDCFLSGRWGLRKENVIPSCRFRMCRVRSLFTVYQRGYADCRSLDLIVGYLELLVWKIQTAQITA